MCDKLGDLVDYDQFNTLIRALEQSNLLPSNLLCTFLQHARYSLLSEVQSGGKQMLDPGGGGSASAWQKRMGTRNGQVATDSKEVVY